MKTFTLAVTLAVRSFKPDWRNPSLRILMVALVIAITAITAVGFFTDRLQRVMVQQAAELLGGDLRISSSAALPAFFTEYARTRQLSLATGMSFNSVVLHQDSTLLTEVKAVSESYPLRGQLRIASKLDSPDLATTDLPGPGEIWVEGRILTQLAVTVGDVLSLGDSALIITKILTYEPDRGGLFFQLSPRVLMNLADVANTGLITLGSRAKYWLLIAGTPDQIANYRTWAEPQLQRGQKLETVKEGNRELRLTLQRAEQFLGLAALVAVLLAGAAIAIATQQFAHKQADACAIMRCLGTTQKLIWQLYLIRLLNLGLLASGLGCLLGWIAQTGLSMLFAEYFATVSLPQPSFKPVWIGLTTGVVTLLGFALLPLLRIHQVPPLRVLRQELGAPPLILWQAVGLAIIAMALLIFWQAGETQLALWMIGGTLITVGVLTGAATVLIHSLRVFRGRTQVAVAFGLSNLARHARTSSVQLAALGVGIMALLLLTVVQTDLLKSWQHRIPAGAPNQFLINIQPEEVSAVQAKLKELPTGHQTILYPMIRGQFIARNDQPISTQNYSNERAKHLADRTFNLSYVNQLPDDNKITAGQFWQANDTGQLSLEEGFAKEVGLNLGDTLQFQIAGQTIKAKVTSLRAVQWDSFHVNFFILATPDLLQGLPAIYVTSFYLADSASHFIPQLIRQLPGLTVINVETIMAQVRQLIARASLGIEYIFIFTWLAGLMVLYAAISASHEERLYEIAILRTLGATRSQIWLGLSMEFITLGVLAGGLAGIIASSLGYFLASYVFNLPYHFNPWISVIGTFSGAIGVGLAGLLGTWTVLHTPPLQVLRR